MNIPDDIWECILQKINDELTCLKLYDALPIKTQEKLLCTFENHLDSLIYRFILVIENCIILTKNKEIFSFKTFESNISKAFFLNNSDIIILLKIGKILVWNYETDIVNSIPDILSEEEQNFIDIQVSYCRNFMFVFRKVPNFIFYRYDVKDQIMPSYYREISSRIPNREFTCVNAIRSEVAISFSLVGEENVDKLVIYDDNKNIILYEELIKAKCVVFDENGDWYYNNKNRIYSLRDWKSNLLMEIDDELNGKIKKFLVYKGNIYIFYSVNNLLVYNLFYKIYCYNINSKKLEEIHHDPMPVVKKVMLIRDGGYLVYNNGINIVILDLRSKNVLEKYMCCDFLDKEEMYGVIDYDYLNEYYPDIFDYDLL